MQGPVWIGHDVEIGAGVRLMGPVVLGDGARVGERAQLRESIVFPGTEVARGVDLDRRDRRARGDPAEPASAPSLNSEGPAVGGPFCLCIEQLVILR